MTTDILDLTTIPKNNDIIFLGDFGRYIRVDHISHDVANRLKAQSEGNTWFTKELDFENDKTKFETIPEIAQNIFNKNISYQNAMDSGVTNGFGTVLAPIVTTSIWALLYQRIAGEEAIHAESYSYALNQVFGSNAGKILDLVYTDEKIKTRLQSEIDEFKEVRELVINQNRSDIEVRKAILTMLIRIYFLEGVKFPGSFFISWNINKVYENAIQGISRLLKLIAHDELTIHVPTGMNVMNILRREDKQGFKELFDSGWFDAEAKRIAEETVNSEIEWNKYLLSDGDIPGYNINIITNFLKYFANLRLKNIKVQEIYSMEEAKHNDTIDWFENYRDLNKQNTMLQEASNTSYIKGGLKNDLNGDWFTEVEVAVAVAEDEGKDK